MDIYTGGWCGRRHANRRRGKKAALMRRPVAGVLGAHRCPGLRLCLTGRAYRMTIYIISFGARIGEGGGGRPGARGGSVPNHD